MGELDSVEEESDEISDEFEFSHEIVGEDGRRLFRQMQEGRGENGNRTNAGEGSRNRTTIKTGLRSEVEELNSLSRQELLERVLYMMRKENAANSTERENIIRQGFSAYKVQEVDEVERAHKAKLFNDLNYDDGDVDNVGSEIDDNGEDVIYDLHDHGEFNQEDPRDRSNQEVRSSWSSSEEALERCEGLIFNVPLAGNRQCVASADKNAVMNISTEV